MIYNYYIEYWKLQWIMLSMDDSSLIFDPFTYSNARHLWLPWIKHQGTHVCWFHVLGKQMEWCLAKLHMVEAESVAAHRKTNPRVLYNSQHQLQHSHFKSYKLVIICFSHTMFTYMTLQYRKVYYWNSYTVEPHLEVTSVIKSLFSGTNYY